MSLSNKSVLVLGAYGGLGRTVSMHLKACGYNVICAGRDIDKLKAFASEIDSPFIEVDAGKFERVAGCFEEATKICGSLHGAVNVVGSLLLKPAHTTSEEEWLSVVTNNLTASFACVKYGSKALMANGGSIVLVSSAAAFVGLPNHDAIAAAKGGVSALARSAAATYARQNIRVNCVAPGMMETPLTKNITANPVQLEASIDMHPLGRIGAPADIAPAIEWLISEKSSWISGETIKIDGGLASLKKKSQSKVSK